MSSTRLAIAGLLVALAGSTYADVAPSTGEVSIKGVANGSEIKLKPDGANWKVHGPGAAVRSLRKDGATWQLVDDKKVMLQATCDASRNVHVTDKGGALIHDFARTSEGWELFGPGKTLAFRVKMKADKVNIYDGSGQRIAHGKQKEDGFEVRDAKDAEQWKIKGITSLADVAFFAIPLDIGELALLWHACP